MVMPSSKHVISEILCKSDSYCSTYNFFVISSQKFGVKRKLCFLHALFLEKKSNSHGNIDIALISDRNEREIAQYNSF